MSDMTKDVISDFWIFFPCTTQTVIPPALSYYQRLKTGGNLWESSF